MSVTYCEFFFFPICHFYSVLFCSILFYSILFYSILFYSTPSHPILFIWLPQDLKGPFMLGSMGRPNKLTSSCLEECAANPAQSCAMLSQLSAQLQSLTPCANSFRPWCAPQSTMLARDLLSVRHQASGRDRLTCSVCWDDEAKAGSGQSNFVLCHLYSQLFSCEDSSPSTHCMFASLPICRSAHPCHESAAPSGRGFWRDVCQLFNIFIAVFLLCVFN